MTTSEDETLSDIRSNAINFLSKIYGNCENGVHRIVMVGGSNSSMEMYFKKYNGQAELSDENDAVLEFIISTLSTGEFISFVLRSHLGNAQDVNFDIHEAEQEVRAWVVAPQRVIPFPGELTLKTYSVNASTGEALAPEDITYADAWAI